MRLVGATDGFIRRPFLIEGFAKGVLGGLLALVLTFVAALVLAQYLNFRATFFDDRLVLFGLAGGRADRVVRQRVCGRKASAAGMSRIVGQWDSGQTGSALGACRSRCASRLLLPVRCPTAPRSGSRSGSSATELEPHPAGAR